MWTQRDNRSDLEAVFTATGKERWDVSFHFSFRGTRHVYGGTAEGSLSEGRLEGTVVTEDKARTFTFSGRFEDGMFRGTHGEIGDDRVQRTGTLTLRE